MTQPLRILMLASEMRPYAMTGGLSDVMGALPAALRGLGHDVLAVLPRYRGITPDRFPIEHLAELEVPFGGRALVAGMEGAPFEGAPEGSEPRVLFVDRRDFYDRDGLYGTPEGDYADNAARFAFYAKAALAACDRAGFTPHVIHAHDWQAGLAPALIRYGAASAARFEKAGRVFTIHNLAFQGNFDRGVLDLAGIPQSAFTLEGLEFYGRASFLKAGIVASDLITTVSRRYAEEIRTPEFGFGMEGILNHRKADLVGILNGVDYSQWDPRREVHIAAPYSAEDLSGKRACKAALLARLGLPAGLMDKPLIGIITRLADQKGMDLVAEAIDRILALDVGFALLGSGDARYHAIFEEVGRRHAGRAAIVLGFDNALAHQIEAGSDLFLMPSRYEPCGLNQIYSLRYGTVPVVRATGGLDDTIEAFDPKTGSGTGFKFREYTSAAMLQALAEAVALWRGDRRRWEALMREGMRRDYSWPASARNYVEVYERAIAKRRA